MKTQTIEFAVTHKDGTIDKVGRTSIKQPKTNFTGGSVKWYKDKPKQQSR